MSQVDRIGILIPALDPDQRLIQLIKHLRARLTVTQQLVIVDDGSTSQQIFTQLAALADPHIHILHHETNRGKGAALKTGFDYFIKQFPTVQGIATMDADGQHTVDAVEKCCVLFSRYPTDLILGTRVFSKNVPLRSRFGNLLTNKLVRFLTRLPISDTQTGLRVIPISYVKQLINFPGERFEFEFDMLLRAREFGIQIREQPIATIYLDGNASSHFRVIRDSIMIYSRFLKFSVSGILSFLVDISLFSLFVQIIGNHSLHGIMLATIGARLLSAIVNYLINRHVVFANAGRQTLIKYTFLLVVQMLVSGYFTHLLTVILPFSGSVLTPVIAKMSCDLILFVISYHLQKNLIFKEA